MICRCGPRARVFAADAVVTRVKSKRSDPTGTMPLQKRFQRELNSRWDTLRRTVPNFVAARTDLATTIGHAAITGQDPVRAFQKWFDTALKMVVVGDGRWMARFVREAGDAAQLRINATVKVDRVPPLQTLAHTELQGIAEAVSQQAVRAYANGLLTRATPSQIARDVQAIIDKIGKQRSELLVSFIIVRTFSAVTLDTFRAAGLTHVGIDPERVTPSLVQDAKKTKSKKKAFDPEGLIEVLTAGDDDVCLECQDISDEGPYTLDEAENLIPAHPRCRCAFVPWGDERYADVRDAFDPDQYRDDHGRWASVGGLSSWQPPSDNNWRDVPGQNHKIYEPALPDLKTSYQYKHPVTGEIKTVNGEKRLSSGVIMRESDGRTWLVKPKNGFGGYNYTFPKGGVEPDLSPQANAIKETYEESGLKARITGWAGDYSGDTSITRMYHAVREDGHPKDHGWETESVTLAHPHEMHDYLNRSRDRKIAAHHIKDDFNPDEPRDEQGRWTSTGAQGFSKTLKEGDIPHKFVHQTEEGVVISVPHEHDLPSLEATAKSHGDFKYTGVGHGSKFYTFEATKKGETTPTSWSASSLDMKDLTKVAGKMGSNEGGVYAGPAGDKYYIKTPKTWDHVQNELIAAKLYQLAGVRTMDYVPVKGGDHVATVLKPLDKNNISHFTPEERKEAQKDFATHAWLANWDAAGTGGDNQVVVNGKVHTVDVGGSLKYRAQGDPKGAAFGDKVTETETMRDPSKNHDAAALYGKMTDEQLIASMKNVISISNQDISKTIYDKSNFDMPSADKAALLQKLINRKNDIDNQMDNLIAKGELNAKPAAAAVATPAPVVHDIPEHEFAKLSSADKVKHLLMKGTTTKELTTKLGWKSIGIPANAAALNLKLEKTQKDGVTHYKGTPMSAAEIAAAKGTKAAKKSGAAAEPVAKVEAPKPEHWSTILAKEVTPKTSESFKKELEAKGYYANITYHDNGRDLQISASTDHKKAMADIAKNHPEWTLNKNAVATYTAPKSAFEDTKHLVPAAKPAQTKTPFETGKPFVTAAGHDINTPLGSFKQSLEEHGVTYAQGTGNSHSDYIDVDQKHWQKAGEIAKWHPAVTALSPESYAVAKSGIAQPATTKPPPAIVHPPATDAELAKAKKNVALQLQYVPGAPDVPKAHELIEEFNKKYAGKTLTTPDELQAKVNAFKDLTASMVPLQSEQQKAVAATQAKTQAEYAATHAKALEAQAAKKAAEKAAFEATLSDPQIKAQYDKLHTIGVSSAASLDQNYAPTIKKLASTGHHITGADAAYISAYVGHHYDALNESLWKGDKMNLKQSIYASALEKSLNKMPSYQGTAVRGVKTAGAFERYAENVGHVVTEKGFSSYGATHKLWGKEATIHLTATDLKDIRSFNSHEGGGELILPRGSMIHITKVDKKTRQVWAEQIG